MNILRMYRKSPIRFDSIRTWQWTKLSIGYGMVRRIRGPLSKTARGREKTVSQNSYHQDRFRTDASKTYNKKVCDRYVTGINDGLPVRQPTQPCRAEDCFLFPVSFCLCLAVYRIRFVRYRKDERYVIEGSRLVGFHRASTKAKGDPAFQCLMM